mmetsp:Transcript_3673/g.7678  ORF Transcript_3673/g.7678 Transcript_3673/m.7678 type:complete len:141 (-) Transcript_3673:353-775(-)
MDVSPRIPSLKVDNIFGSSACADAGVGARGGRRGTRRSTGRPSKHGARHVRRSAHHDLLIGSSIVFVGHVRMTTRPLHVVVAVIDAGGGHFRGVYRGGEGEQLLRGRLPGVHPSAITVRRAIHTEVRSLTDSWGATGKDE